MASINNTSVWSLRGLLALSFIITRGSTCSVEEVSLESNGAYVLPCRQDHFTNPSSIYVRWFKGALKDDDCYHSQGNESSLVTWTGRRVRVYENGYNMDESNFSLIIEQGTLIENTGLFRCNVTTKKLPPKRSHYDVKTKPKVTVVPSKKDEGSNTVTTPAMEAAYTSRDPHTRCRPPTLLETAPYTPMIIFEVISAFFFMSMVMLLSLYVGKRCAKRRDGGAPNKLLTVSNVPEIKPERFNSERRSMIDDQRRKHSDNTSELCSAGAEVRYFDCTFVSETKFHKYSVAPGC